MDMREIKRLSDEEIASEAARLRRRIFDLRTQSVTDKVVDSSQFPKTRKDLARLMTEASSRRIAKAPAARSNA